MAHPRTLLAIMILASTHAVGAQTVSPLKASAPAPRGPGVIAGLLVGAIMGAAVGYVLNDPEEQSSSPILLSTMMGVAAGAAVGALADGLADGRRQDARSAGGLPAGTPAPEVGGVVVAGQIVAGAAATGALAASAIYLANHDHDADGEVLLLLSLAPAAGGFGVCAMGRFTAYQSSCFGTTLGAYLGGLTGGVVAFELTASRTDGVDDVGGYVIAGAILGTAVGATAAWHLGKRPLAHPAPPPGAPAATGAADAWPELRRRPALGPSDPSGARRLMFPVLALTF